VKKIPIKAWLFQILFVCLYMRLNYLIGVNRGGNTNSLIINKLDKTTKIVPKYLVVSPFFRIFTYIKQLKPADV
jgi:hypothetical protein